MEHLEIKKVISDWVQSVQERNIEGILANHSDNIVLYDVPVPFQSIGIEAYRKTWEQSFFNGTASGIYEILDLTIESGSEVAFCFGTFKCSWNNKGTFEDLRFRLTIGLRKINNVWTILHEHHSIPSE